MRRPVSIGERVASLMATMAGALLFTLVIHLPRAIAFDGGVDLDGWRSDRRVWSSAAHGPLLVWLEDVEGGAFADMESPEVAGSVAFIPTRVSGIWWATLFSASRNPRARPEVAINGGTPSTFTNQESNEAGPVSRFPEAVQPPPSAADTSPPGWCSDPWGERSVRRWNKFEWTTDTRRDGPPR